MIPQLPAGSGAFILMHDVRSVHNVGSIFRTADGFGVEKIYISGHTPSPIDRFGRKRPDMAKVALGAEDSVAWEMVEDPLVLVKKLKKSGVRIVALEQDERSVDLKEIPSISMARQPTLLILGREVEGIGKEFLDISDVIAEIPMVGKKESFNVSVSAGVAMYQLFG
ncbi:MAG: tRNA/rRNA methyltransferase SpoU [Candidatus Taylorbacteria bacterium]|nr:tRNA/rRNA methyltransferase SpoU [Candidatus Taylorbacteria bacterium]